MQYNLTINQYAANSLGLIGKLDAIDLLLFDYIYHIINNPQIPKTYINGYEYANIRHSFVTKECPILGINHRDAFRKRMLKLVDAHLLERYENNSIENTSLYRRGELFSALIFESNVMKEILHPADFGRHPLPTEIGTNIILNKHNSVIIDNNTCSIDEKNNNFEKFWNMYDKKRGREQCLKIWNRLSQKDKQEILERTPAYIASTPDKKFRKDPQTYLNPKNKHWLDEIIDNNNGNTEHIRSDKRNIATNSGNEEESKGTRKRDYNFSF